MERLCTVQKRRMERLLYTVQKAAGKVRTELEGWKASAVQGKEHIKASMLQERSMKRLRERRIELQVS